MSRFDELFFSTDSDPARLAATLDDMGAVAIRGAFEADAIGAISRRAAARYRTLENFIAKGEAYPAPKSFKYRPHNHAMNAEAIYAPDWMEGEELAPALENVLERSPVLPVLKLALGGEAWLWKTACTIRKMYVNASGSDQKLPLHCDGATRNIAEMGDELVICCVPLTPFDRQSPKLEFFLPRTKKILAPEAGRDGPYAMELSEEQMRATCPGLSSWIPELEVGDVILMDKYTLHRTHTVAGMSRDRISMDIRFLGSGARRQMKQNLVQLA